MDSITIEIFLYFFWRDVQAHEIDLIFEKSFEHLIPIEIKSRMTVSEDFFKGLKDWNVITNSNNQCNYVVYAGADCWKKPQGKIFSWKKLRDLITEISS